MILIGLCSYLIREVRWEASYAIAGIDNPQFQKNPGIYRIRSVAITRAPVMSMGGIRIQPDLALE